MKNNLPTTEINVAKVPVDGNIGGLLFTIGTVMIFYWGIPFLRFIFPAAIVLGCGVALALHFTHHETPPTTKILV